MRRDFERMKFEDERRFKHEKWLEDQKREILAAKLWDQANPGPTNERPGLVQPLMRQNSAASLMAYPPVIH